MRIHSRHLGCYMLAESSSLDAYWLQTPPPDIIASFAAERDAVVRQCFQNIQDNEVIGDTTHTFSVDAWRVSLLSLFKHSGRTHLEIYYRIACPLI